MITISLIAAVAENGVIGKNGDLPWRIKSEWQYFKKTTIGKPLIMGRTTYETLLEALPHRTNIIITRQSDYTADNVIVTHSLKDALRIAQEHATRNGMDEIFIGGGAEIYKAAIPLCDKLYLTEIHCTPEGDTMFPDFDRTLFVETKREFHKAEKDETIDYTITVLTRK